MCFLWACLGMSVIYVVTFAVTLAVLLFQQNPLADSLFASAFIGGQLVVNIALAIGFLIGLDRFREFEAFRETRRRLRKRNRLEAQEFLQRLGPRDAELALELRTILAGQLRVDAAQIDPEFHIPLRSWSHLEPNLHWNCLLQFVAAHQLSLPLNLIFEESPDGTLGGFLSSLESTIQQAIEDQQQNNSAAAPETPG